MPKREYGVRCAGDRWSRQRGGGSAGLLPCPSPRQARGGGEDKNHKKEVYIMPRVNRLYNSWHTEEAARVLWEAAAKVFEIPTRDAVTAWLAGGPMPALREQATPHIGPSIGLMYGFDGPRGIHVETEGRRYIDLLHDPYDNWVVTIEFPMPGSIVAAGEVIRHALDMTLAHSIEVVLTDDTCVDIIDYPGPVGRELYLSRQGLPASMLLERAKRGGWRFAGDGVTEQVLPAFLAALRGA
jgi:hypothetical protein